MSEKMPIDDLFDHLIGELLQMQGHVETKYF